MNAHRIEVTLDEDRKLTLDDLPFKAGTALEVIILERDVQGSHRADQTEREQVAEWLQASQNSLQAIWDNDEDAVYDGV